MQATTASISGAADLHGERRSYCVRATVCAECTLRHPLYVDSHLGPDVSRIRLGSGFKPLFSEPALPKTENISAFNCPTSLRALSQGVTLRHRI